MNSEPDEFDLNAAWLRRAQTDLKAFMEAFAARLEGALPNRVRVERKRDGLFAKTSHVASVSLQTESAIYEIAMDKGMVSAVRSKVVHGVRIGSANLPIPEWLTEVRREIQNLAEQQGLAGDVLHDFL